MVWAALAVEGGTLARVSQVPFAPMPQNGLSPDPQNFRRLPPRTRWQRFLAARARAFRKLWRRFQRWRFAV